MYFKLFYSLFVVVLLFCCLPKHTRMRPFRVAQLRLRNYDCNQRYCLSGPFFSVPGSRSLSVDPALTVYLPAYLLD